MYPTEFVTVTERCSTIKVTEKSPRPPLRPEAKQELMNYKLSFAFLLGVAPLHAALLPTFSHAIRGSHQTLISSPCHTRGTFIRCADHMTSEVDVEGAANAVAETLRMNLISSFIAATEAGNAGAAMALCTDNFFYKTHRLTTDSLAAAEERLHTKTPKPSEITKDLHREAPGDTYVREIVVKPIPFVTVKVRQEFVVCVEADGVKLCRAEYIKQ